MLEFFTYMALISFLVFLVSCVAYVNKIKDKGTLISEKVYPFFIQWTYKKMDLGHHTLRRIVVASLTATLLCGMLAGLSPLWK
jgi:hypothetical protein